MAFVLAISIVYILPLLSYVVPAFEPQENNTLYLLTLAPFPDERYKLGFAGAPAIVPAVRLALEHINNRTDVLNGYTLKQLEADSGCANSLNSVISLVRYVFHSGRRIVGIVGPACSESTESVGDVGARSEVSLLQVSFGTSPTLMDEKYSNTFRALNSALIYIKVFASLMESNDWDGVCALFQESRSYFSSTHAKFTEVMSEQIVFSSPISESHFPLEHLQDFEARIIFVFADPPHARKVMCLAYHLDMVYPKYQWVFHDRYFSEFRANVSMAYNSSRYNCSETEMIKAISGAILSVYRLKRTDCNTNETVAQRSYNKYESEYNQARGMYLDELNNRYMNVESTHANYSNVYYDAVWALALAFNQSIPILERDSHDLSNYSYGQQNVTNIVRDQLISLDFEGMSGRINFNGTTRERNSLVDVYQVRDGSAELIGVYEDMSTFDQNGSYISDSFEIVVINDIPEWLGIFFLSVITPPVAVATILLHIANVFYCNHRPVKATSPALNHLAFSGCYLFIVGAVTFTIQETWGYSDQSFSSTLLPVQCSTFMWSTTMGHTIIFGSLGTKLWRVSRIHTNFRRYNKGRDELLMSDYSLTGITLFILFLDVSINLAWNLVDPWTVMKSDTFDGVDTITRLVYCDSRYLMFWISSILVYLGLQLMAVIFFSVSLRDIPRKEFQYSKHIIKLVFMLVILFSVGIPLYVFCFLESQIIAAFVIMNVVLLTTVVLCLRFLFLPSVLPLLISNCRRCCT